MLSARLTSLVVAVAMGIGLVWAVTALAGWQWGAATFVGLVYEGWAISNASKHDTISDIIRAFARKQLLTPWLFGFAFGIALATDAITNPYVIASLAVLQGHFFFTLDEKQEEAIKQEAKEEIKEERREVLAEIKQDQGHDRRQG